MSKSVEIKGVPMETDRLASFAFWIPAAVAARPQHEELARLRVDDVTGGQILVRGPEAVTLKVLLASLGIKDLSGSWIPVPDPDPEPDFSSPPPVGGSDPAPVDGVPPDR